MRSFLGLPARPGRIPPNLTAAERYAHLEQHDQLARTETSRLGQLHSYAGHALRGGLALAFAGAALSTAWTTAGQVIGGVGLAVCAACWASRFVLVRAHEIADSHRANVRQALERAREGLNQLEGAAQEKDKVLRQSVVGLMQAPSASLEEKNGYLVMPGVRLRTR